MRQRSQAIVTWRFIFKSAHHHSALKALAALAPMATLLLCMATVPSVQGAQPRARDLGVPFEGTTGPFNTITDVSGVLVGHATIIEGDGKLVIGKGPVRTGVTAILPRGFEYAPVFAGCAILNGNGEMTGTKWIEESGYLEEPILLSNTHAVGAVYDAAIAWRAEKGFHSADDPYGWAALPVVAETWDGRLNDIHGSHVRKHHVFTALNRASGGRVQEGNVGGGTGMVCHQFKGGIGTASRRVQIDEGEFLVGVLVQANYGKRQNLTIAGVPVGREIPDLMPEVHSLAPGGNSVIVIIATDAPLLPHQLKRLASRATLGIGKTGGFGSNSSGDLFLAFSTAHTPKPEPAIDTARFLRNDLLDPLFEAVVQSTEEAVINAMVAAETMIGINGNTVYALPHDRLKQLLAKYGRLRADVLSPRGRSE